MRLYLSIIDFELVEFGGDPLEFGWTESLDQVMEVVDILDFEEQ